MKTRWTIQPARRSTSVASASTASRTRPGPSSTTSANTTTPQRVTSCGGEERRVAPEDVEQRLREGQRGERDQMQTGTPERTQPTVFAGRRRGGAHRGRAWYSTRVPEGRTSRRSMSNASPSARSK